MSSYVPPTSREAPPQDRPQARALSPETAPTSLPDVDDDDHVAFDILESAQFLQLWTQVTDVTHVTLVSIHPLTGAIAARSFVRGEGDALSEWIAGYQQNGRNVYFTPNETRPDCARKPGKTDMVAAVCRFADVDPEDTHLSLAEERDRLHRLADALIASELPPTVIIDSGNGLQPIWAVTRETLTPEVIMRVETETAALEHALGAGGTHNIDRLLRLPGTLNFPNKAKLAKGRGVARSRLIFAGANVYQLDQAGTLVNGQLEEAGLVRPKPKPADTGSNTLDVTLDPAEVGKLVTQLEQAQATREIGKIEDLPADLQARLLSAIILDPATMTDRDYARRKRLADRWAGLVDDLAEAGRDNSRSGADLSLAAMLKAAGFTHLDCALILLAFKHGKANNEAWPTEALRLRHVARSVLRSHEPPPESAWQRSLLLSEKGNPLPILANALSALREAPVWEGVFAWNEFSSRVTVMRHLPGPRHKGLEIPREVGEADISRVTDWLQHQGIRVSSGTTLEAIRTIGDHHRFHPVREYLLGLHWDRVPRIDRWLIDHLGAEDNDLNKVFGAKWLIGCVARVMQPGCKLDTALVLESRQGLMKSTALSTLGSPWFTDHMPELGSKDAMEQLQGVWIIELAELSSLGRAEAGRIKAFLSTRADRFRPSYGRSAADHPRQCGFAGSINPGGSGYLRDETGNRRFWCVKCAVGWQDDRRVDIADLAAKRDQLWAEAVHRATSHEPWWLDTAAEAQAEAEAAERFETDSREFIIRNFLRGRSYTRMTELFSEPCLNIPTDRQTRATQMEIGRIMAVMKWTRRRRRNSHQELEWIYLAPGKDLADVRDG